MGRGRKRAGHPSAGAPSDPPEVHRHQVAVREKGASLLRSVFGWQRMRLWGEKPHLFGWLFFSFYKNPTFLVGCSLEGSWLAVFCLGFWGVQGLTHNHTKEQIEQL